MVFGNLFEEIGEMIGKAVAKSSISYHELKKDLESAKFSMQKRDSTLKVSIRTKSSRVLSLSQRLFEGYGYQPVSLSYVSDSSSHNFSFSPPDDAKKIKSDLPLDYRVDNHRAGCFTIKLSRKGFGRLELDVDNSTSGVTRVRAYNYSNVQFVDYVPK